MYLYQKVVGKFVYIIKFTICQRSSNVYYMFIMADIQFVSNIYEACQV